MTVAAVTTKRPILNGLKAFRQFLQQQRPALAAAPVLLVQSDVVDDSNDNNNKPRQQSSDVLKHVQLLCTSIGLRTATSHPSATHFPFVDDISKNLELAERIGAETVIGVGSTGSIELAKAVAQQGLDFEHLLLVPATLSATVLASASHALSMDPTEPALLAHPTLMPPRSLESSHVVLLDSSILPPNDTSTINTAIYSALVLAVDELCRNNSGDNAQTAIAMIQKALQLLEQLQNGVKQPEYEADLKQLLTWAGSSLSFGFATDQKYRSIPLSLAVSLVPTEFADHTLFPFLSCLLPGMIKILEGTEHRNVALQLSKTCLETCPRLSGATTAVGDDDLTTRGMIAHVHDNQYLWGCMDANDSLLEVVLDASLSKKQ